MPPRVFNPKTCAGPKGQRHNATHFAGDRVSSGERDRREHRGLCGTCGRPWQLAVPVLPGDVAATFTCTTCGTTKLAKRGSPMFKAARDGVAAALT